MAQINCAITIIFPLLKKINFKETHLLLQSCVMQNVYMRTILNAPETNSGNIGND